MKIRRILSLASALLLMLLCVLPQAYAELSGFIVRSAPLEKADTPINGMVRVYLSSMGSPTALDVTVSGSYSVDGAATMSLSDGQVVNITFNTATGNITMKVNGVSYSMGQEMALRRRQSDGVCGLKIAQAKRSGNLYLGDLRLVARESGSGYKLYPIVYIYMENYLYGVVPYEMSASWPIEALKAQAVAARTYTLNRMNGRTAYIYDLVDTASDQVFYGYTGTVNNATRAVDATKGIVIMYGTKLSGTYYTASNGGQTEAVKNIWGSTAYPYLGVKDDPFDLLNPNSNTRRRVIYRDFDNPEQNSTIASFLLTEVQALYGSGATILEITSVTPHTPKYASPSRLYTQMDFGLTIQTGNTLEDVTLTFSIFDELESALSLSINSNKNELWAVSRDGDNFVLTVGRYGHGVGLSQRGAQQMANMGYTYDQILGFYYEGCTRVQNIFTSSILPPVGSGEIITTEAPATIEPAQDASARVQLVTVGDSLPLRYTANEDGRVLMMLPNGANVNVLRKGSSWTLIRYGEINGYVPTAYLSFTGTPPTTGSDSATNITQWAVVTGTNALNFRSAPSTDSEIIGSLTSGVILPVFSTTGNFARVQYGQQVGYCSLSYLTMHTAYPDSSDVSGTSAMVSLPGEEGSAPLRSTASTTGTVIQYVPHGTQVQVNSNDGTWCHVTVAGVSGYMLLSALDFDATGVTPTEPPLEEDDLYAIVNSTASTLNMRSGPSKDYDVIAEIPKGTQIVVTSYGEEWCAVRWGSLTGYVMTSYLSFDVTAPTTAPSVTNVPAGSAAILTATANLTEAASADSAVLLVIPDGVTVTVMAYGEAFTQVSYGSLTGYLPTDCLQLYADMATPTPTLTPSPTPTAEPTATPTPQETFTPANRTGVMISAYDMREEPNTAAAVVTGIPYGAQVQVIAMGSYWHQVVYQGATGWVIAALVNVGAENPTEAPTATPTTEPSEEPTATPTAEPDVPQEEVIAQSPDNALEPRDAWVVLTVAEINLRSAADPDAAVIKTILGGSPITVLEEGGTWSRIRHGGQQGYAYTRHISYEEPREALGIRYINTAIDPLSMRNKPSTQGSTIITRVPRGEAVSLLENLGDWCLVQYGSYTGYCAARYLSAVKPEEVIPDDTVLLDATLQEVTGWTAVVATNEDSSIYLRQWCSTIAPTVGEVQCGTEVTLIRKGDVWCEVSCEGVKGYCLTKQLTLTGPQQ